MVWKRRKARRRAVHATHAAFAVCALALCLGAFADNKTDPPQFKGKKVTDEAKHEGKSIKERLCAAIQVLEDMSNETTVGDPPVTVPPKPKKRWKKAADSLNEKKKNGKLLIECGTNRNCNPAVCWPDRTTNKKKDKIHFSPVYLFKMPVEVFASVLLHEHVHTCQGPMSVATREGYAYFAEWLFLYYLKKKLEESDPNNALPGVNRRIDFIKGCFPSFENFTPLDGSKCPKLKAKDPTKFRPAKCEKPPGGGGGGSGGDDTRHIEYSYEMSAAPNQSVMVEDMEAVASTTLTPNGMTSIEAGWAYWSGYCGDEGTVQVLLLAGACGSNGVVKVFTDTDGDDLPDQSSRATVVGPADQVGIISGVVAMPTASGLDFYCLDRDSSIVYALDDTDDDGVPDELGAAFATATAFPEIAGAQSLLVNGEDDDPPVLGVSMSGFHDISLLNYSTAGSEDWSWVNLEDTNGDGVADVSSGLATLSQDLTFPPSVSNSVVFGQDEIWCDGPEGHSVEVYAFDPLTSDFTELLGSGVLDADGNAVIALGRALVQLDEIIVSDATSGLDSEESYEAVAAYPVLLAMDEWTGSEAGGTTVTLTGESLPTGSQSQCLIGDTPATIISRSATQWVVVTPAHPLPDETMAGLAVTITDPVEETAEGLDFFYMSDDP